MLQLLLIRVTILLNIVTAARHQIIIVLSAAVNIRGRDLRLEVLGCALFDHLAGCQQSQGGIVHGLFEAGEVSWARRASVV